MARLKNVKEVEEMLKEVERQLYSEDGIKRTKIEKEGLATTALTLKWVLNK